jgi:hypothetical protein
MIRSSSYILFLFFSLLYNVYASAQGSGQGGVVVHSDPRLSILLKKVHPEPPVAAVTHKPEGKAMAEATRPASLSSKPSKPAIIKPAVTVSTAKATTTTTLTATAVTTKTPQPAEDAHQPLAATAAVVRAPVAWTPPVLPKLRAVSTGKGFRVQIYNGPDRGRAIEVKTEFMRAYPAVRTYLMYVSPHFRVKVGDYRNRGEAAAMLRTVNKKYSPSMIVPDMVMISTF